MTLDELNALDQEGFAATLGWIFEHSPWVAERAWTRRPFTNVDDLYTTMVDAVVSATEDEQLALIRAHPDLGTRDRLSAASAAEQASAGLDRLEGARRDELRARTEEYRTRFGFPFLFAVRARTTTEVLDAVERRLRSNMDEEREEALRQVYRIASLRLRDVVE